MSKTSPAKSSNARTQSVRSSAPSTKQDPKAAQRDDMVNLKRKTQQMIAQRKVLIAKVQKMRKTIQDRKVCIEKVMDQPLKDQCLRTASDSALQQLREEKLTLQHALESSVEEVDKVKISDRHNRSIELKAQIPLMFEELTRLRREAVEAKEATAIMSSECERIEQQIRMTNANERALRELQSEIDGLTDRFFAYKKTEIRSAIAVDLQAAHEKPSEADRMRTKLTDDIAIAKESLEAHNTEIEDIERREREAIEYLVGVIKQQSTTIQAALNGEEPPEDDPNTGQTPRDDGEDEPLQSGSPTKSAQEVDDE